jgi:hypothetical protein
MGCLNGQSLKPLNEFLGIEIRLPLRPGELI